ncbi:MAG: resuscitation-promoting factor RpfB [Actinomycetota bacterium]|nr:resuscitation-promoting factor RpfB [Actinomycetota bacterium]
MLHPLWTPVHPRRADGTDIRGPLRRTHVLHPSVAPRRGPRHGRRAWPVVPFDIPIEAFAVEVGGGAHPSVRSLGDRRLVYIEHRRALRRAYRRRQLVLAVGLSGAFVAVAAVALSNGGHVSASVVGATTGVDSSKAPPPKAVTREGASFLRPVGFPVLQERVTPPPRPSKPSGAVGAVGAVEAPSIPGRVLVDRPPAGRSERPNPPAVVADPPAGSLADDPFLVCTRINESIYAGGYGAISPDGRYFGAYQFDRVTWNGVARHLRLFDLVGIRPDYAAPAVQDLLAYTLYQWQGAVHWQYRCAGLP